MTATAAVRRAVKELTQRLEAAGQASKKAWWERYLKQTISFYGTPMGDIRSQLHEWHQSKPAHRNTELLLPTAWELFRQSIAEQKLCAILILQELTLDQLDAKRDLKELEKLFDENYIYDWNTTDWLCVRVLGPWIQRDTEQENNSAGTAQHLASWVKAPTLWRQRASLVSFVNVDDTHIDLQFSTASSLADNSERFAQTAIGWVLRERSKTHPDRVVDFLQTNRTKLSKEAMNMASAKLSDKQRSSLGLSKKRKRR